MADIFDEIDDELKRDQAQLLWQRYGKFVLAAVAAVVLAVGSAQGYKAWNARQAEAAANAYEAALGAEDVTAALQSALAGLTDGYEMLARFRLAAEKAAGGDNAGAESAYLALADDASLEPLYQQAAVLLAVMNAPEGADRAALQARLATLTDTTGPWQGLAIELAAALDLQAGDLAAARARIDTLLAMPEISPELRQRARQLQIILQAS